MTDPHLAFARFGAIETIEAIKGTDGVYRVEPQPDPSIIVGMDFASGNDMHVETIMECGPDGRWKVVSMREAVRT